MRRNNRAELPQLGAETPGLLQPGQVLEVPADYSVVPNDELISVNDAAAQLGLKPDTIRKKIQRDEIPVVRLGYKTVRIKQSTIDKLVAEAEFLGTIDEHMEAVHSGEEEMEAAAAALLKAQHTKSIALLVAAASQLQRAANYADLHDMAEVSRPSYELAAAINKHLKELI